MSVNPPEGQDDEKLSQIYNWVKSALARGLKITCIEGKENAVVFGEKTNQRTDDQKAADECAADKEHAVQIPIALKHLKDKVPYIYRPTYNFNIFNFNFNMTDFFGVINEASKRVPFLKYAVGFTAFFAVLAIGKSYGLGWNLILWGSIVLLGLTAVLFLLSKAVTNKNHPYHRAAYNFVCAMGIIFVLISILLVSCTFFDYPKPVKAIVNPTDTKSDSASKDTALVASSHVQTTNSIKIIGHVYNPDNSPAKDANVVLSINNTGQKLTQVNGGFDFTVPDAEIPDTILISVWSTEKGYINKKLAKKDIPKGCDLLFPAKYETQNKSKPGPIKKEVSDICKSLLKPLREFRNNSNVIYAQYVNNGYKFEDAKRLYNLDKKMNKLIRANTPFIPESLSKEVGLLIQHLAIWTTAYENKVGSVPREPNSEFRITYEGPKFPQEASDRILAIKECP